MQLAKDPPIIVAYVPEPKASEDTVKVTKAGSDIDSGLRKYLNQNLTGLPLGGPLGAIAATPRVSVGSPVPLTQNAELLPLFGVDIFDLDAATEHISAMRETLEGSSANGVQVLKLGDHAAALLEQLPNPPAGAGVGFHVIGLIRTLPRAAAALTKPGTRKTVEVGKSLFPVLAALGELVTDIPGLEHGKPYAQSLSWVAKAGEQFVMVPVSAVSAAQPSPARAKVTNPPKSS
jgi:hypothetical protein